MWFFPISNDKNCPNCGEKDYDKKDLCWHCGYQAPPNDVAGGEYTLVFCKNCACYYTNLCPIHGKEACEIKKI